MRPNLVKSCVRDLCVLLLFVGCSLCLEICGILYWLLSSAHNNVFTIAESIVCWKVELQNTVTLSTTKAEYMAAVEAFKEALRLRELVGTFRIIKDSIQIYYISQSVIHLAKDHMYHNRTKHIDV